MDGNDTPIDPNRIAVVDLNPRRVPTFDKTRLLSLFALRNLQELEVCGIHFNYILFLGFTKVLKTLKRLKTFYFQPVLQFSGQRSLSLLMLGLSEGVSSVEAACIEYGSEQNVETELDVTSLLVAKLETLKCLNLGKAIKSARFVAHKSFCVAEERFMLRANKYVQDLVNVFISLKKRKIEPYFGFAS